MLASRWLWCEKIFQLGPPLPMSSAGRVMRLDREMQYGLPAFLGFGSRAKPMNHSTLYPADSTARLKSCSDSFAELCSTQAVFCPRSTLALLTP